MHQLEGSSSNMLLRALVRVMQVAEAVCRPIEVWRRDCSHECNVQEIVQCNLHDIYQLPMFPSSPLFHLLEQTYSGLVIPKPPIIKTAGFCESAVSVGPALSPISRTRSEEVPGGSRREKTPKGKLNQPVKTELQAHI